MKQRSESVRRVRENEKRQYSAFFVASGRGTPTIFCKSGKYRSYGIKTDRERRREGAATENIEVNASLFADFFCERVKEYKSERV